LPALVPLANDLAMLTSIRDALGSRLGVARALALFVASVAAALLLGAALQPLRLNWGDPWSDANVLTTLEYSAKYGFWKTSFTDVLDIGPLTSESYRYTHYPPLTEIFYGFVRKVVGKADVGVYRLFAIAFSGATLYAAHAYVSRVFGALPAACTVIFLASNALFFQYADSIHQAPVLNLTAFAALAVGARYLELGRSRDLALMGLCTLLCFLTAYDYYFFLPLAALGTAVLLGKRLFERSTLALAAAIAVGGAAAIVLKSLFIIGALGWHEFKQDLVFQFFERATARYSTEYRFGLATVVAARVALYMTPAFFALLATHLVLAWRTMRAPDPRDLRVATAAPLVLLVAGVPFLVAFSQLTATQVLPMQCVVPYYAVGFGVLTARLADGTRRWHRAAAIALGLFLVGWQVVHLATFEKAFLPDDERQEVAKYLDEHDRNDFVMTNLLSDGPIQYYFQRHLEPMDTGWSAASYRVLLARTGPLHVVFFEDPRSRFVDKSLFPLLAEGAEWTAIGAPPFRKAKAMSTIARYDQGLRASLAEIGTRELQTETMSVYSVGWPQLEAILRRSGFVRQPTTSVDFGSDTSNDLKLYGLRGPEPGKPYTWSLPLRHDRTALTKTGVVWRDGPATLEAALLLNFPEGGEHKVTLRAFSHLAGQTVAVQVGDRVVLPPTQLGEPWKSRELSFVVPATEPGADPIRVVRILYTSAGTCAQAAPWEGQPAVVGVAFESLHAERLSPSN